MGVHVFTDLEWVYGAIITLDLVGVSQAPKSPRFHMNNSLLRYQMT